MKPAIFFIYFISCFLTQLSAQEVAPFQFKDQKGIVLNKKNLPVLLDKTWTTYKQYYVNKDEGATYSGSFMAFKFSPDGRFQGTAGNRSLSGTWEVKNKRILNVIIQEKSEIDKEVKIGGAYAIYKLSDGELVMVKNLTTDLNLRIVYYCKGTKSSVLAENPTTFTAAQSASVDKKAIEAERQKREQINLISEIETEAQLRGVKLKEKLTKMDVKALQELKKQILSGEYQKMKPKNG